MKTKLVLVIAGGTLLISSCVTVPTELIDARQAYKHASSGPATRHAPTELRKAREALDKAEESYERKPNSYKTRDLAYVAQRKAQLAEVAAATELARDESNKASKHLIQTQSEILAKEKQKLSEEQRRMLEEKQRLLDEQQRLSDEQQKLSQEQQKMASMQDELAKLAAVTQEERGLVITLSGSVLFASNEAILLPAAQARLSQVADALNKGKKGKLIVEGHTDSRGSPGYNLALSQRRADAVKSFLVSRGYPADMIEAKGVGEDRPIANNNTAEGRANNRRVEIVIAPEPASDTK